jgi:antitoxin HicB
VARALRDFQFCAPSFGVGMAELLSACSVQFHRRAQGQPRVAVLHDELTDLSTFQFDIHIHSDRLSLKIESVILASGPRKYMRHKKHNSIKQEPSSEYSFTVFFEPAAEGGYVVTCPALPGLVTEGDTLAEARRMARDAIRAYLESLRKDGEAIPSDPKFVSDPVKEKISVAIPA